jgi:hypothetical protein
MVYFYLLIQEFLFAQVKMMVSSNRERRKKNVEQTKVHLFYYILKNSDSAMMEMMENIY